MRHWNQRASRAFGYLTQPSLLPRVVRVESPSEPAVEGEERASDRVLRVIESEGWEAHSDPTLIDFLATLDVDGQVPEKLQGLVAEMLHFCYGLDTDDTDPAPEPTPTNA
jgi:type III secretion system FlhB-like substrate exporter